MQRYRPEAHGTAFDGEQADPYDLEWKENPTEPLSYRVNEQMRLDKRQGTIEVNSSLTLAGIPSEAFEYVLGTRSALEWVVDQYHRETDPHTGAVSDPNDPAYEQMIVRLIQRVTTVSLATVKLLKSLPPEIEFVGFTAVEKAKA